MRVNSLERIEDIILAMDDLINKKNKMINFIEKKYIKSNGNILSSEYDLYREEKENSEQNFKEKMDELLNILDNICKRVRKKQAALGELSENKLDLLTTKMSFKGNFAWVAFLTFTLIIFFNTWSLLVFNLAIFAFIFFNSNDASGLI